MTEIPAILRTATATAPRRADGRPWVAVQLEAAPTEQGPWRVVNAAQAAGGRSQTIAGRFRSDETHVRSVWVAEGGSRAGIMVGAARLGEAI